MSSSETHTFVYNALSQIDASMRILQLEAEGIVVQTIGGTAHTGYPEIPAKESLEVQIWVPNEQSAKAAEIMRAYDEERDQPPGETWRCKCGETNTPAFQICWKCQADRPA